MSRLGELIEQLCPNGVEYKTLGECGEFFGGLTGKTKKDFGEGNPFLTYVGIFSHAEAHFDCVDYVRLKDGEKQNAVHRGDVLFTVSSETPDECGMACVVTKEPVEATYLNSFCTGWRPHDADFAEPDYLKHVFRSFGVRQQIIRTANGVTRFNVSKPLLSKVSFPVPPIEVQREIVRILDSMQELDDVLSEETFARKEQLKESINLLMNGISERMPLSDCGTLEKGKGLQKTDFAESGIGCIHYGQIYTRLGATTTQTLTFVDAEKAEKFTTVHPGDLVIAVTSETTEDVCKSVAWMGSEDIVTGAHASVFRHSMNPIFASYLTQSSDFIRQKVMLAFGVKVVEMKNEDLGKIIIPCPPITVQDEIAEKLKSMQDLIDDAEQELQARRKQFEYYRDRLLDFPEKVG